MISSRSGLWAGSRSRAATNGLNPEDGDRTANDDRLWMLTMGGGGLGRGWERGLMTRVPGIPVTKGVRSTVRCEEGKERDGEGRGGEGRE